MRFGFILAGGWLAAACVCPAVQAADGPPDKASAATRPAPANDDLEAELQLMLLNRPPIPITRPVGYRQPEETGPALPAEGVMVIHRRCKAERDPSGWVLLTFENPPGSNPEAPRWALPCRLLEQMEAVLAKTPDAGFRVSGETTRHDKRSFLLLRKVTVLAPQPKPEPPKREKREVPARAKPDEAAAAPATKAASRPATKAASGPATTRPAVPSPEEVMAHLISDKLGKPIVLQKDDLQKIKGEVPSVAPTPKAGPLPAGRGDMAVDRLVTLLPAGVGRWLQVSFEADNTLQEPPLRLLPCELLAKAERIAWSGRGRTMRLRVSGQITRYKQRRYLLLRKILEEKDLNQF